MRVRASVTVDHPQEIGRARWHANRLLAEGRELIVTVGDFVLMLSEPAAWRLLTLLAAIIGPQPEGGPRPLASMGGGTSLSDNVRVRVQIGVHAHNPAEVGRPRWERQELVVTIGDVVVYLSEAAARWLLKVLRAALVGGPDVSRGVGEA
jgi:hypothetical protein